MVTSSRKFGANAHGSLISIAQILGAPGASLLNLSF